MAEMEQVRGKVAIAWDVSGPVNACRSYRRGHHVHYIPVLKLAPDLVPIPARVFIEGEALFLEQGGTRSRVYHHDMPALRLLIEDLGPSCEWYAPLGMARWARGTVHAWASLATDSIDPCVSADAAFGGAVMTVPASMARETREAGGN